MTTATQAVLPWATNIQPSQRSSQRSSRSVTGNPLLIDKQVSCELSYKGRADKRRRCWTGTLHPDGTLQVGCSVHKNPSAALRACACAGGNGWTSWRLTEAVENTEGDEIEAGERIDALRRDPRYQEDEEPSTFKRPPPLPKTLGETTAQIQVAERWLARLRVHRRKWVTEVEARKPSPPSMPSMPSMPLPSPEVEKARIRLNTKDLLKNMGARRKELHMLNAKQLCKLLEASAPKEYWRGKKKLKLEKLRQNKSACITRLLGVEFPE